MLVNESKQFSGRAGSTVEIEDLSSCNVEEHGKKQGQNMILL